MAAAPPAPGRKKKGGKEQAGPSKVNLENQEMTELSNSTDPRITEVLKKVDKVFKLFDQGNQKMIDAREAGVVLRALGLYPTEADVQDVVSNCQEAGTLGYLRRDNFVPFLVKTILEGKAYKAPPKELVWTAMKYMDRDKLGFLEPGRVKEILMKQGEPFSEEEADNFLKFAVDPETNKFNWEDYLRKVNYELPDDYLKFQRDMTKKKTKKGGKGK